MHFFAYAAAALIAAGVIIHPFFFVILPFCLGGMLQAFFERYRP